MNFYRKVILPKILNFVMGKEDLKKQRIDVVSEASGIVLEVGFGSGFNIPYYKNISKLYALDPSQELYKLAKERVKSSLFPVEYLQVSAEKIPLADNSIDSIVSTWSLCSIPHAGVALKEMYRVLKPNGKFTFIEHGKSPKKFIAKLQKLLTPIFRRVAGGCHLDREIDKLIREAGFNFYKLEKFQEKQEFLEIAYKGIAVAKK